MNYHPHTPTFHRLLLALCLVLAPLPSMAKDYSSSSFFVRDPSINSGGTTNSTSANFQIRGSLGEDAQGRSTSTNFSDGSGFQFYDDTAPTGGTVNDGAGVDINTQTDVVTLAANWTGFTDNESGIKQYEYRLQRTNDSQCWNNSGLAWAACDVWNNNGTATTFSINNVALALRTGHAFIVCVRATNGANMLGSNACSNGVTITTTLTFSLDASSKNFGSIAPGSAATASSTLTTTTNGDGGYQVTLFATSLLTSGLNTILNWTGTNTTPTSFTTGEGFGYTTSDTNLAGGAANRFSTGTLYAGFTLTGPGDIVADNTTPVTSDVATISYRLGTTSTTKAGSYTSTLVYINTVKY